MRKSVIVFGVARSGTSMTCGVINCLGFQMLTAEPKAHQLRHNPKGMFELGSHLGIGQKIKELTEKSGNFDTISLALKDWLQPRLLDHIPAEGNWGFKAPTIYGIEVLLPYMHNPHVVCIFRNVVDQAKSFQMFRLKNDGVKTPLHELVREMAENANQMSKAALRLTQAGYPVDYVTYEGLKRDTWKETQRIAEFLGVDTTTEMRERVLDFVDPSIYTWKDDGLQTVPVEIVV